MQLTYKQAIEIAEEQAINLTLENNYYERIRKRVNYDLTVLGIGAVKTEFTSSEGIKISDISSIYPGRYVHTLERELGHKTNLTHSAVIQTG